MTTVPQESYDLLSDEHLADPYPLYARLQREAPVHWSESLQGWAIMRHADVNLALSDPSLSANRFGPYLERLTAEAEVDRLELLLLERLAAWFTFADPPSHTRLRGITRQVFSGPMKAMRPEVERMTDALVERVLAQGSADIISEVARPLSMGAITQVLGVPRSDEDQLTEWSDALTGFIGGAMNLDRRRQRAAQSLDELSSYLLKLVRVRRHQPTDDVIGALASIERNGDVLADEEIAAIGSMLLFAGHGTTTNLIGNGLLALLRHPGQMQLLRSQPDLFPSATEELLRYDSPVQITTRIAKMDGAMGIGEARAGDRLFIFVAAANRDPALQDESESLDVARRRAAHVSFGYGIHFCLGAPLARIEAPYALESIVRRLPGLRLAVPVDTLAWQPTVGFRGLRALPIAIDG
jgi:cytochrome P450